ncbi:trans-2-enoyl-CoA reductase family protein [Vibrio aquaticus]|uniref:Enoyl-[acyl-carrier-protein] reductase [NADH] n=1 Tax=Vibrio aquaticus TaxID=2496559 RepID=A0A3S0QF02_9VIBR|nr:enoyl-ACP reductase FabV [Vibrio aquaticus]RTZ17385.1 trans-2-enoyl-CoA reductase family protein [Vibrio aquaticus]
MIIEPVIDGVVARTAHPLGCKEAVRQQIEYVQSSSPIINGPKRVLIIGGSSGFGLASRIALTFGGANADTISVSYEKGPSEKGVGTAGFYNNHYFKEYAHQAGRTAINIQGDAFSPEVKNDVVEAIETYFEGEVDFIIYSVASGLRRQDDKIWRSVIKPIGQSVSGATLMLDNDQWQDTELTPASDEEIEATVKIMGGDDWESWIDALINSESIANGCQTIAFSYIGPEVTHPIYLEGTLGVAKADLHQTSHALNLKLANFDGGAYTTVCKALVTKASAYIPGFSPYLTALYKVMKQKGTHEGCIEQMQRLFTTKLYNVEHVPVDNERLIRIDDLELDADTQQQVTELLAQLNSNNFSEFSDYQGFKQEFLALNGFGFDSVNYQSPIDIDMFIK